MTAAPNVFPIPRHMYPFHATVASHNPIPRPKRRQVKNACTNCQKACKKCDDARPCLRCVRYGVGDGCVSSQRKERKKGIKRGPYKKRGGRGRARQASGSPNHVQQLSSIPTSVLNIPSYGSTHAPASLPPPVMPYFPVSLPPGYVGQLSSHINKPTEANLVCPYYIPNVSLTPIVPLSEEEDYNSYVYYQTFPGQSAYSHPQTTLPRYVVN